MPLNHPQWCDRHFDPVRRSHQPGSGDRIHAIPLTIAMMRAFLEDPRVQPTPRPDEISALNTLIARHAPICCFLGDDKMEELTLGATEILGRPT